MSRRRSDLVRAVARHRRLLAAGLTAGAVAAALPVLAPPAPPGTTVLVAARDLAGGSALTAALVQRVQLPEAAVPDGALPPDESLDGARTSGPVRRGEPLTDVRLMGPGLLAAHGDPDLMAVPVRLADVASAGLLRPGDHVDVLGAGTAPEGAGAAEVVATGVAVLSVPEQDPSAEGALVVLAVPRSTALRLAGAAVTSRLSAALRQPADRRDVTGRR